MQRLIETRKNLYWIEGADNTKKTEARLPSF